MPGCELQLIRGNEIVELLRGREQEIVDIVGNTYRLHAEKQTTLPHSTFLRFPDNAANRMIGLPAFVGGEVNVAGIKWISSFPGNRALDLDRASAVIVINSMLTGRPEAILEGSVISAKRTAASAALAAKTIPDCREGTAIGIIGCGVINEEVLRFLQSQQTDIESVLFYDVGVARSRAFQERCRDEFPALKCNISPGIPDIFKKCNLISIATTAVSPHIVDISACRRGVKILHISLRDFTPEIILSCDNIVDDIDHVCRADTSLHLTEQMTGNRSFVNCELGDILRGRSSGRTELSRPAMFSPFGLGVLDLALASFVRSLARSSGLCIDIPSFFPQVSC